MKLERPIISFNEVLTGVGSLLGILALFFGAYLFLKTEFADAGTVTTFRADHVTSGIESHQQEIRQLVREKRRAPVGEHHYFDADILELRDKIKAKQKRKQNILTGVE